MLLLRLAGAPAEDIAARQAGRRCVQGFIGIIKQKFDIFTQIID
jgi:hypothetical protein